MKNKRYSFRILVGLTAIFIFSILFSIDLSATEYFSDSFQNELSPDKWVTYQNNGSVSVSNGILTLRAPFGTSFPYIYPKSLNLDANNYEISLRAHLVGPTTFGYGVNFTDHLLSNESPVDLQWEDLIFLLWPDGIANKFYSMPCPADVSCSGEGYRTAIFTDNTGQWHDYKIIFTEGKYQVFVDNKEVLLSSQSDRHVSTFWIGNPQKTNQSQTWGTIEIDSLDISSISQGQLKVKTILIPGFGSSWDYDAILTGTEGDDWQIPNWVTVYDNLIASLENAGNEREKDFFVFNYDWRKGLEDLGNDLAVYISSLENSGKISNQEKINLVGHSYGGLVARSYAQNNLERVNKIATLGSPHEGAAQSYLAWEGGQYTKTEWWQKVALELILKFSQDPGESRVETIRRLVPSIKDLLPTENFLIDQSTQNEISAKSMSQQNDFLSSLNFGVPTLNSIAKVVSGDNRSTPEKISVTPRTWLDQILNRWEDGVPVEIVETTAGDGTVTKQSATSLFTDKTILDNNHGELVYSITGIEKVLEILGLDQTATVTTENPLETERVLIAMLRSPGRISIKDELGNTLGFDQTSSIPNGVYLPEEKILIIPNFTDGDFTITVDGNGESGNYKLLVGNLSGDEPLWQEFSARVTEEDIDQYGLEVTGTSLDLLPFEAGPDILEYLQDILSAIGERTTNWSGPEKVRAQLLLGMLNDDFEKIQGTSDDTSKRISFNQMQANTFGIKDVAIRLRDTETESLVDSLLTALVAWHEVEIEDNTNQSAADFQRDLNYFEDLADQIKQQMAENSDFVSPQDVKYFLSWQTLFPEAVRLSETNLESSIYYLRGAVQKLYKLEDKFVQ